MPNIITTTQVQQKIGQISDSIDQVSYIVTNRGQGKIVMLPYFQGCDDNITDYMEDFMMMKNKEALIKRYQTSSKSGKSSLTI